jgi:hypothetical protein
MDASLDSETAQMDAPHDPLAPLPAAVRLLTSLLGKGARQQDKL